MTTTTTTSTAPAPAADDLRLHDLKTYKHCHEIFVACVSASSGTGVQATCPTTTVTLHSRGPTSKVAPNSGSPAPSHPLAQPLATLIVLLSVAAFGTALTIVRGFTDLDKSGVWSTMSETGVLVHLGAS
ncbi:uncharacterized protein SPSK_02040 [Sporothrix schenckii 1099-18]|uniref:Uncharacterized protein n=1 Tax=Sporothrix schenckii 1099-18 TaxID=1397361 RepID=A0A0F2MDC5_SPOSC|nr:uncharacterized protein SPSK_02040 [Sporothrix schenckii 1099-18]KJR86860.1 hypothetical protein SPSK_02040 [Sporothrix schenckii 1099-18]